MGAPQQGMFPLVQTLYNNRPPTGFFYFPTWQSMMAFMERDNTLANFRGNEANSPVTVVTAAGTEHTSPDWDGTTEYATEKDEEKTFEAGSGKHVLLQFNYLDLEEGRRFRGCIYDWVEVRSNNTAITEAAGDKFCGAPDPELLPEPILSKGNKMTVEFHSDGVNVGTGFSASLWEVSKVEEDSFVENYENWGPGFRISFELMILKKGDGLQSIFAFLGRHFANVPQILLDGLKLRFTTSYPFFHGKSVVEYEADVVINTWMTIVIETKLTNDNTYDFVISVGDDWRHTVRDVSAKAIEDVSAWDTHFALKPASAIYKNLVIDPTSSIDTEDMEDTEEREDAGVRSFANTNVGVPFADFNDWINNPK